MNLLDEDNERNFKKIYPLLKNHQSILINSFSLTGDEFTFLGYVIRKIRYPRSVDRKEWFKQLIYHLVESGINIHQTQKFQDYMDDKPTKHSILYLTLGNKTFFQYFIDKGARLLNEELGKF